MVHPLSSVARRYITLLLLKTRDIPLVMRRSPCSDKRSPCPAAKKTSPVLLTQARDRKETKIMIHNKIAVQEICLMFNCWSYPTVKRNLHFLKDCHSNSSTLPTILLLDQEGERVRGDRSDV